MQKREYNIDKEIFCKSHKNNEFNGSKMLFLYSSQRKVKTEKEIRGGKEEKRKEGKKEREEKKREGGG